MRNLIIGLVLLLGSSSVSGSDEFKTEVICHKVLQSGEADSGMEILIQTHPTAWMKRIRIMENGFMGPRDLATYHVPVDQPKISEGQAIYKAEGLLLTMDVGGPTCAQIPGRATASIQFAEDDVMVVELNCSKVK